jgi:hypothetical protein
MAKKKSFGENNGRQSDASGPMAKVIVSKKLGPNKYAFNDAMVREKNVKDYINRNKA